GRRWGADADPGAIAEIPAQINPVGFRRGERQRHPYQAQRRDPQRRRSAQPTTSCRLHDSSPFKAFPDLETIVAYRQFPLPYGFITEEMLGGVLLLQGFARSGRARQDAFFRDAVVFDQRSGPAV